MTSGMCSVLPLARAWRTNSMPVMLGMFQSTKAMLISSELNLSSASAPSPASMNSHSANRVLVSACITMLRITRESSITRAFSFLEVCSMKLKALVIDDSRVMRSMVMQALTRTRLAEWEFIEAGDGAEALDKFNSDEISIAFVDWNMPNMTGIEFVRQARAKGNTEHIPLVMVTSEKAMGKVEEALDQAGANAYICKPFTVDDVERKLKPLLEGIAAHQQKAAGGFFSKLFS